MSLFLSHDELRELTGKRYAPAQKRVLKGQGIRFTEDGMGRPIVLRAAVERRLMGGAATPEPEASPDFSAFPRLVA